MRKLVKKLIFQEVKEIVSLGCWLLKTVGHLAVRLDLAKLESKNRWKREFLAKIWIPDFRP